MPMTACSERALIRSPNSSARGSGRDACRARCGRADDLGLPHRRLGLGDAAHRVALRADAAVASRSGGCHLERRSRATRRTEPRRRGPGRSGAGWGSPTDSRTNWRSSIGTPVRSAVSANVSPPSAAKRSKAGASRKSSETRPVRIAVPSPSSGMPASARPFTRAARRSTLVVKRPSSSGVRIPRSQRWRSSSTLTPLRSAASARSNASIGRSVRGGDRALAPSSVLARPGRVSIPRRRPSRRSPAGYLLGALLYLAFASNTYSGRSLAKIKRAASSPRGVRKPHLFPSASVGSISTRPLATSSSDSGNDSRRDRPGSKSA